MKFSTVIETPGTVRVKTDPADMVLLDPGKDAAKAWNARILPASFIVGPD